MKGGLPPSIRVLSPLVHSSTAFNGRTLSKVDDGPDLQIKLSCSVAKIQVVHDYFMGLIQFTNIRIVGLDRLDSLEARTL